MQKSRDQIGKSLIWLMVAALVMLLVVYAGLRSEADRAARAEKQAAAGASAYRHGDFQAAVARLEKAAALEPGRAAVQVSLGQGYEAIGRLDDAAAAYRRSLAINAAQPGVLYKLAVIDRQKGRVSEAAAGLKRAVALRKQYIAARLLLAALLSDAGDLGGALKEYDYLIKLKPYGLNLADLYAEKGLIHSRKKDRDAAERAWKQALAIDPGNPKTLRLLGVIQK